MKDLYIIKLACNDTNNNRRDKQESKISISARKFCFDVDKTQQRALFPRNTDQYSAGG